MYGGFYEDEGRHDFIMKKKDNKFDYNSTRDIVIRIIRDYVSKFKFRFLIAMSFMLVSAASVAYRAYLIKPAIDKVFISKNIIALYMIPIQLIFVAIACCLTSYMQGLIMSTTMSRITMNLQEKLFEKLLYKDINFFQKQSPTRISSYLNDASGINDVIKIFLNEFILQLMTIISLLFVMLRQNFKLSLIALTAFPMVGLPIVKIGKKLRSLANENIEKNVDIMSSISESFSNIKVIKSNNKEFDEARKTHKIFINAYRTSVNIARKSLITSPMMEMTGTIALALVILYSGNSIINGTISTGDFFTFVTAMFSVYKPVKSFTGLNIRLQQSIACARRYFILLDQENTIKEIENPINLSNVEGNIKFSNVSFYYPHNDYLENTIAEKENIKLEEKSALNNINMDMKSGYSYALVGHSGSGKTTIFNLIMRFYDTTQGTIFLDNIDIKNTSFKSLRDSISVVGQDVRLFNTTILENIKYTKPKATEEEVITAAKMANVDEFVRNMENKYNTIIGHDGALLSGGQKQRISIARALLKNAPILLLDEATSALDPVSEDLIQKSLKILMKGKTTIIIAHRLSTIINCDHIFVLQNGSIVEEGTHGDLLALNGVYKNLCDKQFHTKEKNSIKYL